MLFPQSRDKDRIEQIATDEAYKDLVDELRWLYAEYAGEEIKSLRYSDFSVFYRTGERVGYERKYFSRRAALNACAGLSLLYGGEYVQRLEDIIWAICDEYTWALPAHITPENDGAELVIDLFAAETGFALSEVCHMLGDVLSPLVKKRIRHELERRIVNSFLGTEYAWEGFHHNWAAVCAGSVGGTFLYQFPDLFPKVEARIEKAMNCFLSGYGNDGVCVEGYSYWVYGFGYFVYYAQLLREFTGGAQDWFQNPKVRRIAKFRLTVFLDKNIVASFSDSHMTGSFMLGLEHFLAREYPADISIPDPAYRQDYRGKEGDNCFRYAHFIRSLFWFDQTLRPAPIKSAWEYLQDSQWYINRKAAYGFAAKAGHNGESHNHNDVGSFLIAADGAQYLCDLGMGEYTRAYFMPETRYDFLTNSSLGHSVPIISDTPQSPGKDRHGTVLRADKDVFHIDMKEAYPVEALTQAEREFRLCEQGVTMTDRFAFAGKAVPVTERLVFIKKPELEGNELVVGRLRIACAACESGPRISEQVYRDHDALDATVYFADFTFAGSTRYEVEISMRFSGGA